MKSRPSTTSRLRLEASASGWKHSAGRRLANTPMPARSASRPASGRLSRGASDPLAARPRRPSAPRGPPWPWPGPRRSAACHAGHSWRRRRARSSRVRSGRQGLRPRAAPGRSLPARSRRRAGAAGRSWEGAFRPRAVVRRRPRRGRACGRKPRARRRRRARAPCAAPWCGRRAPRVAPDLEHPDQAVVPGVEAVGIGLAAVLGAAGGQHGVHVRPQRLDVLRRQRGPCRRR